MLGQIMWNSIIIFLKCFLEKFWVRVLLGALLYNAKFVSGKESAMVCMELSLPSQVVVLQVK